MRSLFYVLIATAIQPGAGVDLGAAPGPDEYQVKAAFVYNFAKFVAWPPHTFSDAAAPLTVGVLGQDPFGDGLDQIFKTDTVSGRRVIVKRAAAPEGLGNCQIVFISSSEKKHLSQIFKSLGRAGVLTVGEANDFARRGGVIGFTMEQSRVRFQINVDAAARAGLLVSSKLLNVATVVHDGRAAEDR